GSDGQERNVSVFLTPTSIGHREWAISGPVDGLLAPIPGQAALVAAPGNQLVILNPFSARAEKRLHLKRPQTTIRSIGFCKGPIGYGGRHLWVVGENGLIELFRFSDGLLIQRLTLDGLAEVFGHPESDWLAVRLATGTELRRLIFQVGE